ncbi:MAG: hypothetical protein LBJ83_01960 [Oscillospiraceae bacterium]|nr:hypothetical protein [Oscillospiraceae bacterium]
MNGNFPFETLEEKYENFTQPFVVLLINGNIFTHDQFTISDIKIELTCEFPANFAVFTLHGVEEAGENKFYAELQELFELGAKIEIQMGYNNNAESIFTGFISGKTYQLLHEKPGGSVKIYCMDVKGVMMNNTTYTQTRFTSASSLMQDLLGKKSYSSIIDNSVIMQSQIQEHLIETIDESDYELSVRLAKNIGYEFFVSQGTVYFRKARSQNTPITKLSLKKGLNGLTVDYNIVGMLDSVEVRNTNRDTGDPIKGRAKSAAHYSSGPSASKILTTAQKVVFDSTVNSPSEAQQKAYIILEDQNWNFAWGDFSCVGIPDVIPGRFITMCEILDELNKDFYITHVTHTLAKEKFQTNLKARLSSL